MFLKALLHKRNQLFLQAMNLNKQSQSDVIMEKLTEAKAITTLIEYGRNITNWNIDAGNEPIGNRIAAGYAGQQFAIAGDTRLPNPNA